MHEILIVVTQKLINANRYYTGDNTYNDITKQAILFQTGPDNNFEPQNQTRTEVR
jgi:hypothetical protein